MFKPRKASRPYTDPSCTRFSAKDSCLRRYYNLTVRQVAAYLEDPVIRKSLSESEARIYASWASGNFKKSDFTRLLGLKNETSLDIYITDLENQFIRRAIFWGILRPTKAKKADLGTPVHEDYYLFMQGEDERLQQRQVRIEHKTSSKPDQKIV